MPSGSPLSCSWPPKAPTYAQPVRSQGLTQDAIIVPSKTPQPKEKSPAAQLAAFIARYTPGIAARGRAIIAKMRKRLPGASVLVYDHYNGLVVGFSRSERARDAILSVVLYPRWVTLFFLKGAALADPEHLLRGSGSTVRHIVLNTPAELDRPAIKVLMAQALADAPELVAPGRPRRLILKGIAPTRRPRRPAASRRGPARRKA